VTFEVIVLALASALRPAGVAALYALLSASHPRRVLIAYLVGGFAFSVTIGVIVVLAFEGADIKYGGGTVESVIELVAGAAALGYAAGLATGRAQLPSRGGETRAESRMLVRLRHPSVGTAAAAGVATHLPGLFYLVALNAILAHGGSVADGILAVLVFNAIWYGTAIASVLYFMVRPGAARRALVRTSEWARAHSQGVTVFVFAVVGGYLLVDGLVGLLD
jgi:Sap, sulfolipid-1-addressing protein